MKSIYKISITLVFALGLFGSSQMGHAQDGEKLFKSNCAACHKPHKAMIGPALKGKKDNWVEAGEGELLYEWVKNSRGLIESGTSKMAEAAKDYDPSVMTNQALTDAQIDAVFLYVESYEPKAKVAVDPNAAEVDYFALQNKTMEGWSEETNRMIFWMQFLLMCVLIFGIFMVSKSIQAVVDVANRNKKVMSIVALLGAMFSVHTASAFELSMTSEHFVTATASDNYVFLFINLALLGILLYMKNVMKNITHSYYPEIEESRLAAIAAKKAEAAVTTTTNVLTAAVPVEEEKSILLDHDYDGIQELDNHLPPWWVWSFYACIAFAVYYLFVHHVIKTAPDNITEYEMSMEDAEVKRDAYIASLGDLWITEDNVILVDDAFNLEAGEEVYIERCATCHMPQGQGQTGPNLTDEYWIYGGAIESLFNVVKYGVQGKMPSHERALTGKEIQQVSSYVLSLPEVEGKAPQGQKYTPPVIEIEDVMPRQSEEEAKTESVDESTEIQEEDLQASNN